MNNEKSDNQQPPSRDSLPAAQNKDLAKIWEKSVVARPDIETSASQTERALDSVHLKIDRLKTSRHQSAAKTSQIWLWAAVLAVLAAGLGYLLMPNQIVAPRGEIITHTLPDGSSITLNSGTEITYNRLYGHVNRSVNLQGEAFFTVQKGNHPFRVLTPNATVAVTGTKFNVRAWQKENATDIVVAEGHVIGYAKKHRSDTVRITAGQKLSIDNTTGISQQPLTANIEYLIGWRNQLFYIKDRPLWVIFNELERRFDLRIEISETIQTSDPMTVHYVKPDDPESIIADICRVKDLQYSRTANGFIIKN